MLVLGTRRFEPQDTDSDAGLDDHPGPIPVGLAGLALQHCSVSHFSRPILTSVFLFINGLILLAGERARRRGADMEAQEIAADLQAVSERQKAGSRRAAAAQRRTALRRAAGLKEQHASPRWNPTGASSGRLGWLGALASARRRSWPCCRHQPGRHA